MDNVIKYYSTFDEWGRLDREPIEFHVNWHYIRSLLPPDGHILDNGAGPGKYAIALARSGYEVTLTDLTPRLVDLAREKANELNAAARFKGFHAADARDLSIFTDGQFDAVLMMGPLYHLQTEDDRIAAIKELHRVTKSGGIVFVAFMTRIRHLVTSLMYPGQWKPNDNLRDIAAFMETGIFNHIDEGRFTGAYYFHIDDIIPFMDAHGFETVKLIGSSSVAGGFKQEQFDYWRSRGEKEYEQVMNMIKEMAESPSILGASSHLLYIGQKR